MTWDLGWRVQGVRVIGFRGYVGICRVKGLGLRAQRFGYWFFFQVYRLLLVIRRELQAISPPNKTCKQGERCR